MNVEQIEARLAELKRQEEEIHKERRSIYQASLDATRGEDKLCPDWLAEALALPGQKGIEYPAKVLGIHHNRPCADQHEGKTFLGVMLGRMARGVSVLLSPDGIMEVGCSFHNPAIYVPDLHEVIFGSGSWWSPIKSVDDLGEITDKDIEDIWYVRAMKELGAV